MPFVKKGEGLNGGMVEGDFVGALHVGNVDYEHASGCFCVESTVLVVATTEDIVLSTVSHMRNLLMIVVSFTVSLVKTTGLREPPVELWIPGDQFTHDCPRHSPCL